MKQAHNPEAGEPDRTTSAGVGPQLRQARLSAGLSEEDIAAQLRLDVSVIRQLEADEYQKLAAPTYVRGYLRSYAQLVSIAPEPIIELFNRHNLPPPKLSADAAHRRETTTSDWSIRIITLGLISGLIALSAVWLYDQEPDVPYAAAPESGVAEVTGLDAGIISDTQGEALPSGATNHGLSPQPVRQVGGHVSGLPHDAPNVQDTEKTTSSEPALGIDSQPDKRAQALAGAESGPTPRLASGPSSSEHILQQGVIPPSPKPPREDHIKMHFNHDSWVEVYDKAQKRLYYGLVKSGESLDLAGVGPLQVLLGYAWDVQIEYNDQPFDHTPYVQREGLARFTLDTTASSQPPDTDVSTL